jgi:hypothetical protein
MDDIQFQQMDSWRGSGDKFGLTFKQIILTHINRCVINGSVEWHGGYWEKRYKQVGGGVATEETYHPNSRDVYCNSVRMLRALLLGYFDDEIEEADKKIAEQREKIYEEYKKSDAKNSRTIYNEKKVELHIEWFEELIKLSKRLNFFVEESGEEIQ